MSPRKAWITDGEREVEVIASTVRAWAMRGWRLVEHEAAPEAQPAVPAAPAAPSAPAATAAHDDSAATLEPDSPATNEE